MTAPVQPVAAAPSPAPASPAPAPAPAAPATPPAPAAPAAPAPAADIPALGADVPADGDIPPLGAEPEVEPKDPAEPEAEAEADADQPIDYQFEAPEGQTYGEALLDAYKGVLQKHRVDPAVAADILETMLPALRADADAKLQAHIETQTQQWRDQLVERHGDRLRDTMRLANSALASAASPELRSFLGKSALAANPDFIDMLAWFGQRVTNDRSVNKAPGAPPAQELSALEEAALEYERAEKRG